MKRYIFIVFIFFVSCNLFQSRIVPFSVKKIKEGGLPQYDLIIYHIKTKNNITIQSLANYPKPKDGEKEIKWMAFNKFTEKQEVIKVLTQFNNGGNPTVVPYHGAKLSDLLTSSNTILFAGYYSELKNSDGLKDKFFTKIFFLNPDTKKLYKFTYAF